MNGNLNPPQVYRKEPITGDMVIPIPQHISINPMTAAWCSAYSIPVIEKHVVCMVLDANPYTNLVTNAMAIKAVLLLKVPAMAKPYMAIAIASRPN